jgi:mono/diheme cytochrome c family protein
MKRFLAAGLLGLLYVGVASAQDDFARAVQPVFQKHCVRCHGPSNQKAGLRLDTATTALAGNDAGKVIVPGKSADSRLMKALTGVKDIPSMPPPSRPRLQPDEIAAIRRWIDAGAVAPKNEVVAPAHVDSDHWSFQPIARPELPDVGNDPWVRNAIDRFILARLREDKLTPSPEADRATLIRRVSLDLIGLPPSPEEVADFLADTRPDAYDRVVDRLLASPHYGERWARHWLDLARYGDSHGFTIDGPRSMWPYRDWVIDALNQGMPIDRFITTQLAGDLLPKATLADKIATGFHRNTPTNQEGGIDVEMFRVESIVDRVNTTGAVFLGLTVGCCQCHDHKYDPISQREYYRMFAFFNNCDEPTLPLPTAAQKKKIADLQAKIASLEKALKGLDTTSDEKMFAWHAKLEGDLELRNEASAGLPRLRELLDMPIRQLSRKDTDELRTYYREADQVSQRIAHVGDALPGGIASIGSLLAHVHLAKYRESVEAKLVALKKTKIDPASTLVMQERKAPRDTFFLMKGDFTRKGNKMSPGTPAVLPPLKANEKPTRLDFANWLVAPENPLTRRVYMNRVWQHCFGLGLVETENDFGLQGTPPSHPELLDWLASEFGDRKWNLKAMHKLIVTSATYRQASKVRPELTKADPRNRLLGRQNRLRLESEVVRDVALSASGLLNPAIGGPSVFPPQPDGVFAFTQTQRTWPAATGPDRYRRGMYTYFWRSAPHPALMAFDSPDATMTCTRRNRSNTPLQALTLLNDKGFFEFAQALATKVLRDAKDDPSAIKLAFRRCLARDPSAAEQERVQTLVSTLERELAGDEKEAARVAPANVPSGVSPARAAAWTLVARTLLNLDEFITRE